MLRSYFTYNIPGPPHTFYSFDHLPIFIIGGGTHVFSDPSLQHPTPGKPQMLLQKPLISYFVAFTNNRELNTSLCWLRSKGYHLFFFVGVFVLKNKMPPDNNTCNHCLKLRVDNYSSLVK